MFQRPLGPMCTRPSQLSTLVTGQHSAKPLPVMFRCKSRKTPTSASDEGQTVSSQDMFSFVFVFPERTVLITVSNIC